MWVTARALGTVAEYEEVVTKLSGRHFHRRALERAQLNASPLLLGAQHAFFHTVSCSTPKFPHQRNKISISFPCEVIGCSHSQVQGGHTANVPAFCSLSCDLLHERLTGMRFI